MLATASARLSPEIRVEQLLPEGQRYVLPRRDLGKARWVALPLAGGGLIFSVAVLFWTIDASGILQGPPDPMRMIFAAVGIPGICIGFLPTVVALAMLYGHSEIEVRDGRLRTIERLGLLRWSRARSQLVVKKLVVEQARPRNEEQLLYATVTGTQLRDVELSRLREEQNHAPTTSLTGDLEAIRIQWDGSKPWLAAIGYPREMLVPLAHDLAARCRLVLEPQFGARESAAPVEVVEHVATDPVEKCRDQPLGSQIVVTDVRLVRWRFAVVIRS